MRPLLGALGLAAGALRGRSFDSTGARSGFLLLSDGVHLASRGAALVADRMEGFGRPSGASA